MTKTSAPHPAASQQKHSAVSDAASRQHESDDKLWPEVLKLYPEVNFLQSPEWGEVNRLVGHKVIVEHNLDRAPHFWCQMIVKNAKRGRYLEVPGGPLLDWSDKVAKQAVFAKIREIAEREKCVFVRLRPQLRVADLDLLRNLGLRKAPMHLHAEHTIILDLTQSEDDLLKAMRRQTRYEVRRAEKLGITVSYSNEKSLFEEFHQVQAETAARQHFIPPDLDTLLAERTAFGDNARLYVAHAADGAPIAYGLILISGDEAEYFEAASTELNHKLPGAYALQWQVIRDLKALGLKRYNLWGIAPANQPEHRYAKVTTFKKGFGGEIVEFVPAQDLIINSIRYKFNLIIETIRKKTRHL